MTTNQSPLDRLAEHYGPGNVSDKAHPLFAALWEPCPAKRLGSECYATYCGGYHRRSRAESEARLLSAAKAAGYRGIAISMNDDGSWEAEIEGTISPPHGASICTADDPYEALAAALLGMEAKP